MEDELALLIPIIALLMPVFIVWTVMHFKHQDKKLNHMSGDEIAELEQMSKVADILDQRVAVLERILDDEVPDWRAKND
ncbi:phage shock protein B [Litorimonas taeanensis]|uniref:Phage shock protein B n=1 Tax=Litorimonas taeanensis TaxID=568099 RepID=A0A420WDV7_9PROT|nr:envelope stress response membrane protein PspB [Litorimonas taeanensis]RKQ69168.1 phage shock protein B [Litorimonas taeanensis]